MRCALLIFCAPHCCVLKIESEHRWLRVHSTAAAITQICLTDCTQVENQEFLSFEAVRHLIGQLTTLSQAPRNLDTPDYLVLRRFADCDVRR
jgi:hypothetical protein